VGTGTEASTTVDSAQVFSATWLRVHRSGEEDRADEWIVRKQEGGRFSLEAGKSSIQHGAPEKGELVRLRVAMPDAAYQAWAKVEQVIEGDRVQLVVEKHGDAERIQRREHFRVSVGMPVEIAPLNNSFSSKHTLKIRTVDVSAGGIHILSPVLMRLNGTVRLTLDLGDGGKPITCKGKIVRWRDLEEHQFEIGLAFFELPDEERERIIDVLLAEMRKQISR